MNKFDGLLMASGGLDSTVLAYKLLSEGKNIVPLFINYGQHFANTEEERFLKVLPKEFIKNYKKIDVSDVFINSNSIMVKKIDLTKTSAVDDDVFLPYRNMFLLSSAIAFASSINIQNVYSAFINSNHAKEIDATSSFLDYVTNYFKSIGDVSLYMPLREYTKADVLKLGISLNAPVDKTFSCQVYADVHCGACANCVDRQNAFNEVINEKEVKILEEICDSLFKKNIFDKESSVAYCNLLPLLVDCTLQQGMNYNTFVVPRVNRVEKEYSYFTNISQVPIDSNFINDLLNVKNKRKINMFISILKLLRIEKVENINSFYSWIKNYENQQKMLAINGLGQKTLDYILNLLGIESIPVDRHIYKFLNICGIYTNKYEEASTIINFTAEKNGYNKIIMDKEIWHYMKTITI